MTPLFESALDSIVGGINVSTGLAHPNDLARTVEMFGRLLDAGEAAGQDEISEYLQKTHRMDDETARDWA